MKNQHGFLLMEALILILILSVGFVSFVGVTSQALKVSSRTRDLTESLSRYEMILFEIENGLRPDLAVYGGRGPLSGNDENRGKTPGYGYEITNQEESNLYGLLKSRILWKEGREALDFDLFVSQRGLE